MKLKEKIAWLYNNHIYWRRPSARFEDMYKKAVKIKIIYL